MKILGAGGHAKVVADIITRLGIPFEGALGLEECEVEVEGVRIPSSVNGPLCIAIGDNRRRELVARNLPADYPSLIDPSAVVSASARVGEGTVVMQHATIQADASIGRHCIVNTAAVVDHECELADFVHVSPHATLCGGVKVGEGAWIGAGAVILPGIHIGARAVVGAGCTIRHNVEADTVAFG